MVIIISSRFKAKRGLLTLKLFSFVCVILIVFLVVVDVRLRPLLYDYAQTQAKRYALEMINRAVSQTLKECDAEFNSVVNKNTDESGKIVSLSTNAAAVDTIVTEIFLRAHKSVSEKSGHACKINIGTLSGSPLLYGKGPALNIFVQLSKYINYELISGFNEAGINQTKNSLYLKLTANIHTVIPGESRTDTVSTKILLAETVIVGDVPDGFTEVIQVGSSEFDTADTLVNFGQ